MRDKIGASFCGQGGDVITYSNSVRGSGRCLMMMDPRRGQPRFRRCRSDVEIHFFLSFKHIPVEQDFFLCGR